jgi:hypothetical protein
MHQIAGPLLEQFPMQSLLSELGIYNFLLGLALGVCLGVAFANHFRFRRKPYKPHPGHDRAEQREKRWYPLR